jgi:GNAT superfamily N-acetyltransferase
MIEVRPVRMGDGGLLREVRLAALAANPGAFLETYDEVAADSDDLWAARAAASTGEGDQLILLALDGERPVGMAGIARDIGQRRRHRATLWGVWLDPECRGRGVGRRLVQGALDWATSAGVRAVYLEVVENEDPSWSLYGRLGFVRREVDPFGAHVDGRFVALERLVLVLDEAA